MTIYTNDYSDAPGTPLKPDAWDIGTIGFQCPTGLIGVAQTHNLIVYICRISAL